MFDKLKEKFNLAFCLGTVLFFAASWGASNHVELGNTAGVLYNMFFMFIGFIMAAGNTSVSVTTDKSESKEEV